MDIRDIEETVERLKCVSMSLMFVVEIQYWMRFENQISSLTGLCRQLRTPSSFTAPATFILLFNQDVNCGSSFRPTSRWIASCATRNSFWGYRFLSGEVNLFECMKIRISWRCERFTALIYHNQQFRTQASCFARAPCRRQGPAQVPAYSSLYTGSCTQIGTHG